MSDGDIEPSHDKTGIKTSTFYNQKKLKIFPKLINPRTELTNAKGRPSQAINKSTTACNKRTQKSQKNITKKSPMSNKGSGKKHKTNAVVSERLANCKAGDITDLQIGKRPLGKTDSEDSEQGREFKKLKLDLNKNFECEDKCPSQRELCTKRELENEQGFGKQITRTEEINSVNGSNDNGLAIDEREATETSMNYENDIILIHSSDNESSLDTTLNSSLNVNDKAFTTDQRKPSHATKESENDVFGSPLLFNSSQNSLKEPAQNNTDFNSSQNIKDKAFTTNQREPFNTTNGLENDTFAGTLSSSCESVKILKQSTQSNKKLRRSPRKKLGSLDAFVFVENTRTSKMNEKLKDSGFHEPFRILGELSSQEDLNCSSVDTSPLLSSQSSTSTGYSGSSKSKSISPESQSSIMKYFTPLRKSSSVVVLKSNNVSPTSDKKGKRQMKGRKVTSPSGSPVSNKKEQMFLDLGQKNFGHITCPTCNMVYTSAQPEDEAYHVKFHHTVVSGLRFKGWKTERVVEHFDDGRVIVVLPQDPPSHLKKVSSVRTVVDDELGFSSETSMRMQDSKTYMFVADKKVVGCVVAVVIQE
ncbi:Hypothetical predicted protein, partial [Paramuricea clavata]